MEPIGQRLDTGEMVLREVGRGAWARVYLVSDGRTMRALKLLPAGQGDRVDHEYRLAHDLVHPNIGRVDARVELGGRPGLLMPLVLGRRLLARGSTDEDRVAYLDAFAQLLTALGYLHGLERVHRDVKPENVLVERSGRVRLVDFDLALHLRDPSAAPRAAGTVAYLSPEQARGASASPASDLYAAGVMLYAALTGEVPFHGTVAERFSQAPLAGASAFVPRPSRIDATLGPADDLLTGMLALDPADRFADAGAAAAALAALRATWPPTPTGSGAVPATDAS